MSYGASAHVLISDVLRTLEWATLTPWKVSSQHHASGEIVSVDTPRPIVVHVQVSFMGRGSISVEKLDEPRVFTPIDGADSAEIRRKLASTVMERFDAIGFLPTNPKKFLLELLQRWTHEYYGASTVKWTYYDGEFSLGSVRLRVIPADYLEAHIVFPIQHSFYGRAERDLRITSYHCPYEVIMRCCLDTIR